MHSTDTIGHYVLERELGRGAFGVVYLGHHDDRPDIRLAIKTVPVQGNADRALVEPELLSRLKHPCIVGLEDYFVEDGKLVLVLEYIPGEDLKAAIDREEEFSPEQVRDFLAQMASALAVAHAQQIVHRDMKPSNVLVDTTQGRTRYVLTDFGVGREADGVQSEKHVGGTYLYMAPEQLRGRPSVQSDLWALGVVAYQMLTGKLPFPGPSLADLSKQIQYTDPTPPSDLTGKSIPPDLETAVLGLLHKSLTERISSAKDLLAALGVRGDSTRPTSVKPAGKTTVRDTVPLSKKLETDERRTRAKLMLGVILFFLPNGIVSSLLFVAGAFLFYRAQATPGTGRKRLMRTIGAVGVFCLYQIVNAVGSVRNQEQQIALQQAMLQQQQQQNPKQLVTPPTTVTRRRPSWVAQVNFAPAQELMQAGVQTAIMNGVNPLILVGVMGWGVILWTIGAIVYACGQYANLRRIRRDRTLLNAALAGRTGTDEFLTEMRDMVNARFPDVGFHLRYAELLYARGDLRAAAVEARLICVQDPYNFNANLLQANAYLGLGLYRDCLDVCDEYLDVTGYSFEFSELRKQAAGRMGAG